MTAQPSPSASPTPSPTRTVKPAPVRAFILGDSIALSVAGRLASYGYPVTGRVGQAAHAAFLQQQLSSAQAQAAPAWVIVLGANNRGDAADVTRLGEWIDTIKELRTPGSRQRVYWVTPHRPDSYAGGLSRWSLDAFNAELVRLSEERRWLKVLDFSSLAQGHPEWYEADAGHLHPDVEGQAALVALIAGTDPKLAASPAIVDALESAAKPAKPVEPAEPATEDPVFDNSTG